MVRAISSAIEKSEFLKSSNPMGSWISAMYRSTCCGPGHGLEVAARGPAELRQAAAGGARAMPGGRGAAHRAEPSRAAL